MAEVVRRRAGGAALPLGRHVSISRSSFTQCASASIAPPHPGGAKCYPGAEVQGRTGPSRLLKRAPKIGEFRRSKGHDRPPAEPSTGDELMKYRDCIIAWTPNYGPYDHLETAGEIAVGPHPDTTVWSGRYAFTSGVPDSRTAMSDQPSVAAMLVA